MTTRKGIPMCDLPSDLESDILSRVPAKSLWELKTTCKRWYALFRDPKFAEKNRKLGNAAARESMLLSNLRVYSIAGDLHGLYNSIEPSIEFTGNKLTSLKDSKDLNFHQISLCDGLMLCFPIRHTSRLVVWNICTGQMRLIKPRSCYRPQDTYALGYTRSSSGHSYKILRCCCYRNYQNVLVAECEIYELSSGSWRVLDHPTHDYSAYCKGVSLKGDAYFLAGDRGSGSFFLTKFDFTTERFVRLPLPFKRFGAYDEAVLSAVRDEKLSVLHLEDRPGDMIRPDVMRIWVTNKIDGESRDFSWRRDFVLILDSTKFRLNVSSFLLDEENKLAVCCDKDTDDELRTIIYITGGDMYKQVYKDTMKACSLNTPLVLTYVPSLVRI